MSLYIHKKTNILLYAFLYHIILIINLHYLYIEVSKTIYKSGINHVSNDGQYMKG